MSHHMRSFSEQPHITPRVGATDAGGDAGPMDDGATGQPQSFIRFHSNSQQSLEQLFNPTLFSSAPLRERNLPSSFFNPSANKTETNGTTPTNGNNEVRPANSLHNRSISFDQRNPNVAPPLHRQNFHLRTHSTLAPLPRLDSNQSSHQSSHEFLNNTNALSSTSDTNNNDSSGNRASYNNVSSCQQHCENIASNANTNNHHHNNNNHLRQHHHHSHSNGWSSVSTSMEDVSSTSWIASRQQQVPIVPQQAVPVVVQNHHQPTMVHEHAIQVQARTSVQHHHDHHQHHHHHQPPAASVVVTANNNNEQTVFYNSAQQTIAAADTTTAPVAVATSHACPNHHSIHSRSISYQQQRPAATVAETRANFANFHMRTHSTIDNHHMTPSACHHHLNNYRQQQQQGTSQHSSHQSSLELLNHSSATNSSGVAAGWSSSGYSTDDMTSPSNATTGHGWATQHRTLNPHLSHQPNPSQVPTQLHNTAQQTLPHQPVLVMDHHQPPPSAALGSGTLPEQSHTAHHHHNHIPMQVQQQTGHQIAPQQVFYNV